MTKSLHQRIALAAVLAGIGFGAIAQSAAPQAAPGTPAAPRAEQQQRRFDPAKMQERMAQRMAQFKQKLAITPQQEGAWSAWTNAMKPPANRQRPNREEFAKLTTPERIDRMRALRTERMAEMDKRADATKSFYAALTPEQKKVFDGERFGRGHGGGHRHGHHGHRG